MTIVVLFAQRVQRYEGEYGLEALACATEHDVNQNPEYLDKQLQKYRDAKEFESLAVVGLDVRDEQDIRNILSPPRTLLNATVVP